MKNSRKCLCFFFPKKKGSRNLNFKDSHFFRVLYLRNFRIFFSGDFFLDRGVVVSRPGRACRQPATSLRRNGFSVLRIFTKGRMVALAISSETPWLSRVRRPEKTHKTNVHSFLGGQPRAGTGTGLAVPAHWHRDLRSPKRLLETLYVAPKMNRSVQTNVL